MVPVSVRRSRVVRLITKGEGGVSPDLGVPVSEAGPAADGCRPVLRRESQPQARARAVAPLERGQSLQVVGSARAGLVLGAVVVGSGFRSRLFSIYFGGRTFQCSFGDATDGDLS